MSEVESPVPVAVYPTLTTEQKLAVRDAQFVLQATKETTAKSVESASQSLLKIVADIAVGYGVNPETTLFRQEDLSFVAKP
jgi:hypothetical protein